MSVEIDENRRVWDLWAEAHLSSFEGRLRKIEQGHPVLTPLETELLSPFSDRRLLHLQCHLGLDLFALRRLGFAHLAGADFSPAAIAGAQRWRDRLGMVDIAFQCDDARGLAAEMPGKFEIVLINYGSLCWVDNIFDHARFIARLLAEGGRLVLIEIHPLIYAADTAADKILLRDDYLETVRPHRSTQVQTHAGCLTSECTTYEWNHGLGEIFSALSSAGFVVESLEEHETTPWRSHGFMESIDGMIWRLPSGFPSIPLSYSIIARKTSCRAERSNQIGG